MKSSRCSSNNSRHRWRLNSHQRGGSSVAPGVSRTTHSEPKASAHSENALKAIAGQPRRAARVWAARPTGALAESPCQRGGCRQAAVPAQPVVKARSNSGGRDNRPKDVWPPSWRPTTDCSRRAHPLPGTARTACPPGRWRRVAAVQLHRGEAGRTTFSGCSPAASVQWSCFSAIVSYRPSPMSAQTFRCVRGLSPKLTWRRLARGDAEFLAHPGSAGVWVIPSGYAIFRRQIKNNTIDSIRCCLLKPCIGEFKGE